MPKLPQPSLRGILYSLLVLYATAIIMFVVSIVWSNHVAADTYNRSQNNLRLMCNVLKISDGAYKANPPTTPIGRQFAEAMHNLVQEYGC